MNNEEIFNIALKQSAYDCNCQAEDFLRNNNVVTISKRNSKARSYLHLPYECDLVSYGNNIVAQVSERTKTAVIEFIEKYPAYRCFETPNIYLLNEKLNIFGLKICFMAKYFLPDITKIKRLTCDYDVKLLYKRDFEKLYKAEWSNALCAERKEFDILGVGAYDKDKLVGLAACSADCESMYQIGIDVLPEYRQKGIASALTSNLACEIIDLGKVPFYCAAWSNIKSERNAVKCGFRPAWVELTAREYEVVDKICAKDKRNMHKPRLIPE